jgi:enoyl-CoA hydratase/carnithine racemase
LRIGLVTEVVPRSELRDHARDIAVSIAERDTKAIQGTVRAIWESLEMPRPTAIFNGYSYTQIGNPPPDEVHMSKGKGETRYR